MTKKKKRKIRIIIIIFVLLVVAILAYFYIFSGNQISIASVKTIKDYEYVLEKRDNELFEEIFKKLKTELSKEKINNKKYAEYISKLFIIDFYTLNNKNSKYDIGGVEYIYPESQEKFEKKAQDTIYNYLSPSKKLPEVKSIEMLSIDETSYVYNDKEYEGYKVKLSWEYKSKNKYDNNAVITVINVDNKLYIASILPEEDV